MLRRRRRACTGRQPNAVVLPKQGVTPKRDTQVYTNTPYPSGPSVSFIARKRMGEDGVFSDAVLEHDLVPFDACARRGTLL